MHEDPDIPLPYRISVLAQPAAPAYDLLLRGGHVLDDKNHIDGVMDRPSRQLT